MLRSVAVHHYVLSEYQPLDYVVEIGHSCTKLIESTANSDGLSMSHPIS